MQTIHSARDVMIRDEDFLEKYIEVAPLPLAIERSYECQILSKQTWIRPCLDIGSGDGLFAHILFREPVDVGVDLDPSEIERSRTLGMYKELHCCSAEAMPFPDGHFQTVLSNSVLEHIPQIDSVLKEVHRVLAPNGAAYFTLPTDYFDKHCVSQKLLSLISPALARAFQAFFNRFWNHHHYYSQIGWTQIFEKHGFRVEECKTYDSPWSCHLNNLLTPFSVPAAIWRKYFKRWFLSPVLRAIYAPILSLLARPLIDSPNRKPTPQDGLIFFHLVRR